MDMMSLRRRVMVNQNKLMTATGNPITFNTPLTKPLKECVVRFTPKQEGSGTPSPDNVRNISGRSSVKLWQSGGNLLDVNAVTFTFPETVGDSGVVYGGYLDTEKGEVVAEWKKVQLNDYTWTHSSGWSNADTYCVYATTLTDASFPSYNDKTWLCNVLPSATRNEGYAGAYKNVPCFCFSGYENTPSPTLRLPSASVSSIEEATNYIADNNITVAYKITDPIHYSLIPQSIATLKGTNTMWSDTNGDISVKYWTR